MWYRGKYHEYIYKGQCRQLCWWFLDRSILFISALALIVLLFLAAGCTSGSPEIHDEQGVGGLFAQARHGCITERTNTGGFVFFPVRVVGQYSHTHWLIVFESDWNITSRRERPLPTDKKRVRMHACKTMNENTMRLRAGAGRQ